MANEPSTSRVCAGRVDDIPMDLCVSVGSGAAIVARVKGEIVAFKNECLHQQSPLAGGLVREGTITCPMHFWRYRIPSGVLVGEGGYSLERYRCTVEDGLVWVDVPVPSPEPSIRDTLLRHTREWKRDA